jgi:predicted AlkP superfamily pyrophosphatase or phosphodiesterase
MPSRAPSRVVVLNVVGLTKSLLGEDTPALSALARGGSVAPIGPVLPAVTCSVQATYLTGVAPSDHGVVGNGWYFRDLAEVMFWRQSAQLLGGERLWEAARRHDPSITCANLFWWFNMYCGADLAVTVRLMYPADGRKIPDIYTTPTAWRETLNRDLGAFPLFRFWGPMADISSSNWIARSALRLMEEADPTITLVYLPHLDYPLQRLGPDDPAIRGELRAVDALCGQLIDAARARDARVVVLSEYGISPVSRPVHINRAARSRFHGDPQGTGDGEAGRRRVARLCRGRPSDRPCLCPGSSRCRPGPPRAGTPGRRRPCAGWC